MAGGGVLIIRLLSAVDGSVFFTTAWLAGGWKCAGGRGGSGSTVAVRWLFFSSLFGGMGFSKLMDGI